MKKEFAALIFLTVFFGFILRAVWGSSSSVAMMSSSIGFLWGAFVFWRANVWKDVLIRELQNDYDKMFKAWKELMSSPTLR